MVWGMSTLGMVFASPALAHNVVEDRVPAPGSSVTESPVAVSITTDDDFLELAGESRGFAIAMTDAQGLYYGDGCVSLTERHMVASINLGEPGIYSVIYQFVSADGHSVSESYDITFDPAEAHIPAPGSTTPPACDAEPEASGTAESHNTTSATAAPDDVSPAESSPQLWLIATGSAAVIGALALIVVLTRRGLGKTNRQ
jgi:methionine-rich copper-binding protein CopC